MLPPASEAPAVSERGVPQGQVLVSEQDATLIDEVKRLVERYWSQDRVPYQGARMTDIVAWGMVLDLFPELVPYPTLQQADYARRQRAKVASDYDVELVGVRDAATGEPLQVMAGDPPTVVDARRSSVEFTASFYGSLKT
jgi:hypothetical protein